VDTLLLRTKLRAPAIRSGFVSRGRLLRRLDDVANGNLVLVSAPAGFGKTSLLCDWLRTIDGICAWLTVDVGDNDPSRFLDYLTAAVRESGIVVGSPMTAPRSETRDEVYEAVLPRLLNAIDSSSERRFVLVIDDYHLISNREVHRCVDFIATHLPDHALLVVSSRADPPLSLSALRAGGGLCEIRVRDLRFDLTEAVQFFLQAPVPRLTREEVGTLHSRTEGWAAGLQMAAVSMSGHPEVSAFIRSFAASNRYVLDYLVQEVVDRQSKPVQRFLLATSILNPLCGRLCEYVTEDPTAQMHLDDLERRNVFITPLDNERGWYHYHRLFADLLQRRLEEAEPERLPALHRRAGRWYEEEGMLAEAIRHYGSAHDSQEVTRLLETRGEQLLADGEFAAFTECLSILPETTLSEKPLLSIYFAFAFLVSGESLQRIADLVGTTVFERTPINLEGEHAALKAMLCAFKADAREGTQWCRIAVELLPPERVFLKGMVQRMSTLLAYTDSGEVEVAIEDVRRNVSAAKGAGNAVAVVTNLCELGDLYVTAGHLRQAEIAYCEGLDYAAERENLDTPASGLALIGLGNLLREQGELRRAETTLVDGIARASQLSSFGCLEGQIALARTRRSLGEHRGVAEAIEAARRIAERFDATELDDLFVDLYSARFFIRDNNVREAARIMTAVRNRKSVVAGDTTFLIRELTSVTEVRLLIASEQVEAALIALESIAEKADSLGRRGSLIEMLVLTAIADSRLGRLDCAVDALGRALRLAAAEGYSRVFLDEGLPMLMLLEEARRTGVEPDYVARLLGCTAAVPRQQATVVNSDLPSVLLTNRESEVLSLLSDGITNQEIADRLFISVRTVKWHTVNIYQKMGVSNRTQAVAKARSFGMLPD